MDVVSIVVPVYNTKKYLNRCIDSILSQSYSYLDVILVDDGSTDGSGDICDFYAKKDSRVRVFHVKNGGPSRARNVGLDNLEGQYVLFVDSDDWVDKNFVNHYLCEDYKEYDAVFGMWDVQTIDGVINPSQLEHPYISDDFSKGVMELSGRFAFELNCNKMLKASIVREHTIRFKEGIHSNEDDIFTYDYARYISKYIVIPGAHYHEVYVDEFDRHLSARVLPIDVIYETNKQSVESALRISKNPQWIEYQHERLFYRLGSSIMNNIIKDNGKNSVDFSKYIKIAYELRRKYCKRLVNRYRRDHKIWALTYDIVFMFRSVAYVRLMSKVVSFLK